MDKKVTPIQHPLLNTAHLNDQLKEYAFSDQPIREMLTDDIISTFASEELSAIKTDKQNVMVICDGKRYPTKLIDDKKNGTRFVYDQKKIKKICHKKPSVVHWHGVYLGTPSKEDIMVHQYLFEEGFQTGTIVGMDGLHIVTPYKSFHVPWSNKFYDDVRNIGVELIPNVKSIACKSISAKKNADYHCELTQMDGTVTPHIVGEGVFVEIQSNQQKSEFLMNRPNLDLEVNYGKISGSTCTVSQRPKNKKILTCFVPNYSFLTTIARIVAKF